MATVTCYTSTDMAAACTLPAGTVTLTVATPTVISGSIGLYTVNLYGAYTYNNLGLLTGGTFTGFDVKYGPTLEGTISGLSINVNSLVANPAYFTDAVLFAGNDAFNGSSGIDVLLGYAGNDILRGAAGNDTLSGGDGNDVLVGGVGNDVLNGGAGLDWAYYNGATAGVCIDLGLASFQNTVGNGVDVLTGIENLLGSNFNDILAGNALANALQGGAGADRLSGGGGNDILLGGAGKDALIGGAGNDLFDFNAASESCTGANRDVIVDFVRGADRIDLSTIDANNAAAGNNAFTLTAGASFTAAGQVRFANGILYGNTDGNLATAEFEIALSGVATLTAQDFIL